MRALFLSMWYPNQENPVFGTFVHEQATALRNAGVEVKIVQPIPLAPFPLPLISARYRQLAAIPARETYEGFDVMHPRYLTLPRHMLFQHVGDWMFHGVRATVERLYKEWPFDVIHAHATFPCGAAANRLRDECFPDVKVVHTVHRTCIIDAPNYNAECYQGVRRSLLEADATVFVASEGQNIARTMTEGLTDRTGEYITNGVNIAKFTLSDADAVEVAALKQQHAETWNLVFVGYLNERKGMRELLPAVAELVKGGRKNLKLFLVGRNELGSYVADFVREHGLGENVVEIGPVHHSRMKIWMNFADGFILPSHSEGLPTVLFESLFAGAPSIFTQVGGVADIAVDGENALLIPPRSIPAIRDAIARLMDDAALCDRLSTTGHALIRDHYTWQINAERHVALYRKLTGG